MKAPKSGTMSPFCSCSLRSPAVLCVIHRTMLKERAQAALVSRIDMIIEGTGVSSSIV